MADQRHVRHVGGVGRGAVGVLALAALAGGCAVAEAPATEVSQSLALQMSADSQYMMSLLGTKEGELKPSTRINLADPVQHRFLLNRLAAAGKTAANSPYLFERIQKSRERAVRTNAVGSPSAASTDWCANVITQGTESLVGVPPNASIQYNTTHPNVSCAGGAIYVFADITTYNSNKAGTQNLFVASSSGEDYSGGTNFNSVAISPSLPARMGGVNKTDSVIIAYDDLGNEQMTFFGATTDVLETPVTVALVHPTIHPGVQNGGNIQICQLRGLPNQCDYATGMLSAGAFSPWVSALNATGMQAVQSVSPWTGNPATYLAFSDYGLTYDANRVYLPLEGTLDVGSHIPQVAGVPVPGATPVDCKIKIINTANFWLVKAVGGGYCEARNTFKTSVKIDPTNRRKANFKVVVDFATTGLVQNGDKPVDCSAAKILGTANPDDADGIVSPVLSLSVIADCGDTNASGTPINTFRAVNTSAEGGSAVPYEVQYVNSCLAAGTAVRLADGSLVAVEKVKAGDKVRADAKGTVLTVTGVAYGAENEPLVELRDNKDHRVRVTTKHPMIRASGEVALASAIRTGDQVMTDRGIARITSVARIPYTGQVYNMDLGTPDEKAKVGKNGTTMFAAGFLVGDNAMQQAHSARPRAVAQLPAAWSRDYHNATINNPPIKRILR